MMPSSLKVIFDIASDLSTTGRLSNVLLEVKTLQKKSFKIFALSLAHLFGALIFWGDFASDFLHGIRSLKFAYYFI